MATRPHTRLLFADGAWWGLTTEVSKVWARGPRPVPAVGEGRSWTPVLAAAEPATGCLHALVAGRFDARWFGLSLAEAAAPDLGERVILVVDNAGWHPARGLRVLPNRPEANPVEQGWQWLHDHHTGGERFHACDALLGALCRGLVALMDGPHPGALPHRLRHTTARCKDFNPKR